MFIRVGGRQFGAHKVILKRYEYFRSHLNFPVPAGSEQRIHTIDVQDYGVDAVQVLLSYLYSGHLDGVIPLSVLTELLMASHVWSLFQWPGQRSDGRDACQTSGLGGLVGIGKTSSLNNSVHLCNYVNKVEGS